MSQGPARPYPGMLALVQNDLSVDENVLDALTVAEGIGIGRLIEDALGVEKRQAGVVTDPQQAAVVDAELGGVQRRHLADRVFQSQHVALADVQARNA